MKYVRLDEYDYRLVTDKEGNVLAINIYVDANNAIEIADISSELVRKDNRLYVDGLFLERVASAVKDRIFTIYVKESKNV